MTSILDVMPEISRALASGRWADASLILTDRLPADLAHRALAALIHTVPLEHRRPGWEAWV